MNKQFCRVGKIKPNLGKSISLKEVEKRIAITPDIAKKYIALGFEVIIV